MKILARGEQAFDEERGLDEIAGVVEHTEDGKARSAVTVHEVRPDAVIARSFLQERDDLVQTRKTFVARDESAIDTDDERHDAESARSGGDDAVVAGNIL